MSIPVVFVHVHYEEVWREISQALAVSFSSPFRLVLTSSPGLPELAPPATPHLRSIHRITVKNKGRDIWPFLTALERCDIDFEVGLKLHTKRSMHRADGDLWRRYIVESLLSRPDGEPIAELMAREKRIGLVAPRAHLLSLEARAATNTRLMQEMLRALEVEPGPMWLNSGHYSAGSMFWFRREALSAFRTDRLAPFFAEEQGQLDGTAAHAAERLFAEVVKARGYLAIPVEVISPIKPWLTTEGSPARFSEIIETFSEQDENPFAFPIPKSWRRYPQLFLVGHFIYLRFPGALRRMFHHILKPRSAFKVRDKPGSAHVDL